MYSDLLVIASSDWEIATPRVRLHKVQDLTAGLAMTSMVDIYHL